MTEYHRAALQRRLEVRKRYRAEGKPLPPELTIRSIAKHFGLTIREVILIAKEDKT